jgi:hypothetical protein
MAVSSRNRRHNVSNDDCDDYIVEEYLHVFVIANYIEEE